MKFRTFIVAFVAISVVTTMVNDYVTIGLNESNYESTNTNELMRKTIEVSDQLLITNYYATRFARDYVITGNNSSKEYFQDILKILNGELAKPKNYTDDYWDRVYAKLIPPPEKVKGDGKSVEEIFLGLNITPAEFNKLKEANLKLAELSKLEVRAMEMAAQKFGSHQKQDAKYSTSDMSSAIRSIFDQDYIRACHQIEDSLPRQCVIHGKSAESEGSTHVPTLCAARRSMETH